MCNLNVLITTKPSHKKWGLVMERLTTISYSRNSDADGVYFSGTDTLLRDSKKINYVSRVKDFNASNIVIGHQRLTTSGYDETNHQPLETDEFVIAHNGVFTGIGTEAESDTVLFFRRLTNYFNSSSEENREKALIESLEEQLQDQSGSYSVFIYDKVTKQLYYFKNSSTSMHVEVTNEWAYFSTVPSNEFLVNDRTKKVTIEPNKLYKITHEKRIRIKKIHDLPTYTYNHVYPVYGADKGERYYPIPNFYRKAFTSLSVFDMLKIKDLLLYGEKMSTVYNQTCEITGIKHCTALKILSLENVVVHVSQLVVDTAREYLSCEDFNDNKLFSFKTQEKRERVKDKILLMQLVTGYGGYYALPDKRTLVVLNSSCDYSEHSITGTKCYEVVGTEATLHIRKPIIDRLYENNPQFVEVGDEEL